MQFLRRLSLPLFLLLILLSSAEPSLLRLASERASLPRIPSLRQLDLLEVLKSASQAALTEVALSLRTPYHIHLLRPQSGSAGSDVKVKGVSCSSWQFAVETNNLRGWRTVPASCMNYFGNYMLGHRYRQDSRVVIDEAVKYARSIKLAGDGKEIWIFDIDETTLSNLPYFSKHGFGVEPYNATLFDEWVSTGKALALPESLRLYGELLSLGFKVVFLTGRKEHFRDATIRNLNRVGYFSWEKLILKGEAVKGTALQYKSGERSRLVEEEGYRIVGNIGDQWSDILGSPEGERSFKLPDPLYYIS